MHHTCAYFVALANVADTDVPAINDGVIALSNSHFLPQRDYDLLFAAANAVTLTRARIVSPTNRQISLPFIRPINAALLPTTDPNIADYRDMPFRVNALEELAVQATDSAAGPNNCTVVLGLGTQQQPIPRGNVFTFRGTGTTTVVANAWSLVTITWADILPAGIYAVVGMEAFGTTCIAARLTFDGQYERPGCIGSAAPANRSHFMFQKGGLGVWGSFRSTRMPIVEFLCNAADTAQEVYIDIVKIG